MLKFMKIYENSDFDPVEEFEKYKKFMETDDGKEFARKYYYMETDFKIGDVFTFGYVPLTIKAIGTDEDGTNKYLMSDGRWRSGFNLVTHSD